MLGQGLVIVSGKGATGKSAVAAAIELAASGSEWRTLLVKVEGRGEIRRTLGVPDPGLAERPVMAGLTSCPSRPTRPPREYLRRHLGPPGPTDPAPGQSSG
jgi:Mrp family chromosome partitioning ATPase